MEQPYLQQVSAQAVYDYLLQHSNKLFPFVPELMDIMLTGKDQSQANQPKSLLPGWGGAASYFFIIIPNFM
eukprot:376844-Pelagomonas_calceolata.AAC.1